MTPNALYTYVICNKHNVRDKLMSSFPSAEQDESDIMKDEENSTSKNTSRNESSINESVATCDESDERILESRQETIFTINIPKSDFEGLIIHKKYQRTEHKRRIIRHHTVLQPGMWQHVFCQKIWEATKLSCGFNFKNHKLTSDGQSGYANGTCKCGSTIKCKINNKEKLSTIIKCRFTEGNGRCGKRYLRRPIRDAVVENMRGKFAMAYRAEMAEQYMDHNNKFSTIIIIHTNNNKY